MDEDIQLTGPPDTQSGELNRFADSYAAFTRTINSLQRKYLELDREFMARNEQLVQANLQLTELTERNLAANRFLNGILDIVSAGVIAVDCAGRITLCNPTAASLLETKGQLVGKLYRDVIPPGVPPDANALRSLDSGASAKGMNKSIDLPSGVRLHLTVSTSVLRDEKGEVCGAVEVFHDLSRIRRMESELARLNTLAALGEMAASVAHEVRNPLAGIAGFVSLLERDLDTGDPKKRIVDKIMLGVNNLNETVTSLLNYTRFDELNPAEVAYPEYLRGIIEQFDREYPQGNGAIAIRLSPIAREEQEMSVRIDRLLIRQVFFNLFANGADAMGGNGAITVTVIKHDRKQVPVALAERLLLKADETLVETRIADNGPGIPAENLEKIFSPFFSTKKNGNGLGLAVGQKIARAHGGEILAENSPEGGAMFRLFLPVRIQHQGRE